MAALGMKLPKLPPLGFKFAIVMQTVFAITLIYGIWPLPAWRYFVVLYSLYGITKIAEAAMKSKLDRNSKEWEDVARKCSADWAEMCEDLMNRYNAALNELAAYKTKEKLQLAVEQKRQQFLLAEKNEP